VFINGSLNLNPDAGPLTIMLNTLDANNSPGEALFDAAGNYNWTLIQATGGINIYGNGFDPALMELNALVQLNLAGFSNFYDGQFALQLDGNALNLIYTGSAIPEPMSLSVIAGVGMLMMRRRRSA